MRMAAADMTGSARTIAGIIAEQVSDLLVADFDKTDDPVLDILRELTEALDNSPQRRLATDPEIDSASILRAARLEAFEGRGFRHLAEAEWAREQARNHALARDILTQRYRRHLTEK